MTIIGIIPAGGSAYRFNGIAKELLPISQHDCGLTRAVKAMQIGGATSIHIATRHEKTTAHWRAVESFVGARLTAREFGNLWEFVRHIGATTKADRYFFAMPDTVFPIDAFIRETCEAVTCGLFKTDKPERFGVVYQGKISDKVADLKGTGTYRAWGVWIWSRDAMDYIVADAQKDQTAGLNNLIACFGMDTFEMDYYHDFAAFEDYREFLCSQSI